MATAEVDIPEPVCETIREEEERKMVDQAANKVTKEEKTSTDNTPDEPPETLESNFDVKDVKKSSEGSASTIESENFLRSPLIAEVSFEAKNLSDACKITEKSEKIMKDDTDISQPGNAKLDDQPLEITGSEETILEGIKENAEESNGKYGEKNMASVPSTVDSAVSTSGTKAGDIIYGLDQEDITVEIQMSKDTSTEDDGTTNSVTKEMGSPEENLRETILQRRESKGSEIPNVSEVKNLNREVTMPNDGSGRAKTTKDEIPCILVTDMSTEGESSSDQNETVNENSEKNTEEMAGSFLKSKTTDETSSENAVKEEMSYDGNKTTGLPILIETANEEIKERKNGGNAKNLSCSPLVTTQIEEISSEHVGLGNELHNIAEKASQEKNLDRQTMTAVISHEYELQGENESESSFLKEKDDIHIQKGDKTLTTPEYSETIMEDAGKKSQEEIENQSKTLEENITIHTNATGTEETEENALTQDDGSQIKHEVHLEKEAEKPCFTDASMRDTSDESAAKNEDEELRKAELSENEKDMESISVVKEATMQKHAKSLEVESSISVQNTETTSSLEEKSRSANPQEIMCDEIEQTFEAVDRTEETLKNILTLVSNEETEENSTIEVDGSQMKGEEHLEKENKMPRITETLATDISNNESTLEGKMKDADLRKDELIKNQRGIESALLKQEETMEKPIDSLQIAHEDIKASTSDGDTRPSSLENQILTENPQQILGNKTESKSCGVVDTKEETLEIQAVPTIESNDDSEDNSVIKEYDSEGKYEERLDKECEKLPVKEASISDAIDDKSTYMQEDKFEDKDLRKAEQIENQTDTENTPLKEEKTVMTPIESLQLDPEDIRTYPSDHGTETASLTASSQGNLDGITEDIAIENVTTIVLNEDIEEKSTIKVDGSQIKQEEYLEGEGQIPFTIEVSTGKTSDDESIINHVDNTEHEDLRKAELHETEKNTESTLLKKETQVAIPIKSLQVVAEDIVASTSCQGTETSSQQERKLNAHENLGQKIEDKTINAADTKEKTPEAQNVTTIFSNENSKENFLIQMDGSNIKHEELSEKEGEMLLLSETLAMESNNEESKVIHEDKDAESTSLKEGLQVDKPIEFLKVGFEDIEASVSRHDQEATSSLMDQSITANPNEIIGEQTEEKISDAGDTKEKTPEVQNFTTIDSNENAEKNSLIQVDSSQKKHEKLFENERKIPALSETLTVETNNQESTVIQEDKIADEDLLKVYVYQQEESTFLKEEAQLDKPIESLQTIPGDSKASTLCQDTETRSFLEERSLTENPLEFEGDQAEDKIIDAADTKEKASETHLQNFATAMTNENTEENSQQHMDGSQAKHEELLNRESKIPFLSETLEVKTNDEESKIINEDKNAEITLLKEEVQVGQPIESLQVAREEIEAPVSCQDPETSSLRERSLTENSQEIMGGQTEDKIIGTADIKDKTPEAQNFTPIFSNDNAENNSLIEVDASQRKQVELFEKERELPALSETLMAETNIKESIIIHEEKTEDENIKKVAESESEKHIESTFLNEEAQVNKAIESLSIAPEDGEASASSQETETSFLKERSQTANSQEIEGNQTEHKIIDAANTKEKLPEVQDENSEENSLLQMDGSQMKHEELLEKEREIPSLSETSVVVTSNQESIIIHEKKYEDEDLQKKMLESEKHAECTLTKEEAHIGKPIESLQVAPEDNKASCQHIETTGFLVEQSLIANTQFGDQTEAQVSVRPDTEEKTPEAQGLATVVSNEKTEENPLEKEREIPSVSEALIVETNNEESTVMHEDKIEDKDLEKIDQFESKKHAESNLLKEEVQVDQPTKSLQAALKEIEASVSCQDPETNSLAEQDITANPQEIMGDQTKEKIIDTADTKEKTLEAQISTTIVSKENADKNSLIQVGASQKEHEDLFENERDIPALSESSTVETNNQESMVIHEDKIEDEDLQKIDVYQQEEALLDKPIESFQAPPGDRKASASGQDTESKSFLEEQCLTENPQEIKGDQTEDKLIDAADTKEKTSETHNSATAVTNENIKENSLLQMDCSKIKHEDLLNKEKKLSLSETLAIKTNNEESKIIHEDKDAGSTTLKEEAQVDQPIKSLQVALEEIEASVPSQDPETTNSLAEQSITANPQEIMGDQTEDKIIEAADTKEKTLEAQISPTIVSNENSEKNSLIQVDASLKKHEDLFENEREIPALSDVSTVETNNQESTVIQKYKIEDEDLQKVHVYEQDKRTLLKEVAQLDKPIEYLQAAPGDSKASASSQDTETTSFLEEHRLTENPQEIEGDQTEDKIIDAASTKEKASETHNFATIVTNENIEENSLLQMDGSKIKHEELLNEESEIPSLSEILTGKINDEESKIIHEDKDAGSTLFKEEVLVNQPIESLQVALQEIEASVSCQDPEATNSLVVQSITANPKAIMNDQTEDKIIDTADTKEKTLEAQNSTTIVSNEIAEKNLLIQVDASQKKHEDLFENEREIPALSEASTVEINNQESTVPQEIEGNETEDKLIDSADTKEKTSETHNFATIVRNVNIEENSPLQMDGSKIKHEELLNEEIEIPSLSKTLAVKTNDEESKITPEDKDAGSTLLKEEVQVDQPIESLQVALKEIEASVSCQDQEATNSTAEQSKTANPQEIMGDQTEDKIIDTADTQEKTLEAQLQNSTSIVSNEIAEKNLLIQVDASQKKHEDLFENEREIPALSEASTVETNNQESTVSQEDKVDDKDLHKVDVYEHEESTLLKEESQLDKPIKSLQAPPGDSEASASWQDTETRSFLEERIRTENPQEIEGNETEDKLIDSADTKEKTSETHNFATIVRNVNIEENSLLQMDGSTIKHEEILNEESEIPSLSKTLAVKTNDEESIISQEDKDAGRTLLKEEVQVDQPIKSLQVALKEIEASVSCQDPEATNSTAEQSKTANPQEIMGDQTEDKIIDTADTQEKTLEAQNSTTILSSENVEKNSLIQVDASQKKHEDLFEYEREIPALSEASMVETNNQVSTVSQEDKIGDEDLQKVDVYQHEESTLLMEEVQLDKPIEYLQAPPGDSKTSASWQDTETTSFLEERSPTENPQEIGGEQTEDKTIDATNTKAKTSETHNFSTTVANENIEENSLLQMDGSKIKHEEHLNEEREIPSLSKTLAVTTNDEESKITPEDKDAGSTLLKEEVQVDQPIETLQVALKEIEASVPCQDPETTCSLADTRLTENTQEIVGGETEDKIIDTADIKEKTPEAHNSTTIVSNEDAEKNSLIQVDASHKKHEDLFENEREVPALSEASTVETNNEESIIIHEDKIEDQDVKKVNECESEKQLEITFLHEEAKADKPIKSLNVAPEDSKVSPSRQDTETSSFLEERSLTENPREIAGDQIEEKTIDAAANTKGETPYTQDFATIVTNDKTDDDSLLQMDGSQLKHEELLEKERETPSSSETLVEEANNEESTIAHNDKLKDEDKDKFEDEDLKTVDMFEEKHAICTSSVEESHVDEPIESLQVASEDSNVSCQHLEKTSSPKEQSLTAYPQFGNQTENKIYDAPDTKEKTCEAQGFTAVVSNENIEENAQMPVDGSQIIHEILETKREIPSLSETLTVKTNNGETTSIHEDKIEEEDLKNDDIFESEKYAESNLLKDEAWGHQSIESLQVAPEDIKAPAPRQDTETRSSLEDQSPTANPKEIEGDQAEAEIIDASDTKEKTQEAQGLTTIASNENAESNSLIQLGASQKKHEEQMERETPTLSDTLMVESHNEKSTIIHEDNIEDKDLKKDDGYKNAEAQVDTPIESLQVAHEDIKASPSRHDTVITSSLEERSLTVNPQDIVFDQTVDRIIDAADTEEESPEAQDFATNVANDETKDNSLIEMDGSQLKHEELLEKEKEIPSSSETLVLEANNEWSTILHKDKSEDEDPRTVDPIENEKFIESTLLKEETKVGKHVESLQTAPEDIKASASCQERDTTSTIMEQSLTANAQETVSEQMEDKIIATTDTKDKAPDALKKVTKIISNEENESVIPCCKSTDLDAINQLKEEELNGDLLKDVNYTHSVNAATTKSESTLQEHVPAADVLDTYQLLPGGEGLDKPEEDCTIDLESKLQDRAAGSNVEEINKINDEASITELPNSAMKNDTSKVSMIEEVSSDICTDKGGEERNNLENPDDQDGSVAPHGENDDQSEDKKIEANDNISGQIIGKKVLEDNDEIQDSAIEKQMTENQHIAAQSEPVADEMNNAFQEAPGEIQNIDSKAKTIETIEEEDNQKIFQMISAVDPTAQDGKESDSKSSHSPETKSSSVDIETVVDIADDANCEKLRPSTSEMSKEDVRINNEKLAGVTSSASETSETNSDHKIVGEANGCHQKTDIQEIGVSNTGSIKVSINENQMEACSEESTEVQVPQGETKVEEMQQDPVVRSDQKDIEGNPINVSHIVSETTGIRADNSSFEESSRQSLQEIGNKEPQEKYQGLENLAHVKDLSMDKTQKDVQLCVAITYDSSIIQEMQVPEEDYIPSPDENIIDRVDHKESEAAEDATNYKHTENLQREDTTESIMDDLKHLEPTESDKEEAKCNVTLDQTMEKTKESTLEVEDHSTIERDLTTAREEMLLGRTTKNGDEAAKIDEDDEEEEEKGKKIIPGFSSKAPITMEVKDKEVSRLVYDAADENFTSGAAEESNILNGMTGTADSKVMKREATQKDTLDSVKSIEGLGIISHDEDPEIPTTASKVIEVQEVGNLIASETSVLVSQSERANFDDAQIGSVTEEKFKSNEVDFAHRESTAVSEFNDHGVNELESREITTIENNSEKNGKEINRDDGTGYKTKNESVEEETQDDINYVPEKQELQGSVLLSKELPFKTYSKMEKITYDGEANEESVELGEEEKLKDEVNPNYNARKKEDNDTVNSISKSSETVEPENMEVEDPNTKEDKLEEAAAAEVQSDQIVAEDTLARKETMKVYISTDEVKEETEGEKSYQGDEEKPEEDSRINTEEILEAIQNANENKKVPKVLGEADATDSINEQIVLDDKVVEESDENIQANEPKDGSLHQQENETSVDQVMTGLDNKEKEHELDHQIEKTSIEDPREEVNSYILVFQEEEYNGTGANGTNNVMTKDAELLTMNNKNTSTTMTELQEDHESKQGSLPLAEVLQVQESEKQDKNDEIFSSDKVQGKEEEKMTISASKSDVEADKVDNLSRLTEDENNKNKIEVEKLDFSSHTKDASEISQNDHNSNENVEAKVSNGGKEADIIQQDLVSNTVKQEIQEQHLENTVETVLEEKGMNSEEDEIKDDSCNDSQENFSSVDTDKVAPSNILQGSIGEEVQGAKSQETARQRSFLPILPHVKCSDMEIAQKDITLHLAKQDEDDLKELEESPLPTTDKPVVLEAYHTDNANTNSPLGSNIPMLQHGDSSGSSLTKGEKQEPTKFEKEEEKCGHEETTKLMKTEQSTEIDKHSLSDLLQLSGKETLQSADHFIVKPTIQKENLPEEKSDEAAHEEAKTDEEKDDEGELSEHKSSNMSSDAPVMVDAGDTDVKVAHKKSHNILSGVGSKVKHSIAKVKKAITGKSSHPKSHSPKYGEI